MPKSHILVIDDDTRLRMLLGRFLSENGFKVELGKDAAEARGLMQQQHFDLLIIDVMMPNEDGVRFTQNLRQTSAVPVIMLTARGAFDDRIKGLEAGADDYLPKPFEPKELLLRINNILKRTNAPAQPICQFGEFSFSFADSRLKKGEQPIHITESETKILAILCREKNSPVSREKLSDLCNIDSRSVDVQITRLRKKIEQNPKQPQHLQTVRNLGYVVRG
ncbi:MAG: response regulator [Alphaproteobacteria bacterium]|nr:response regulator [Alphaproteobacteria bacterium]